MEFFFKFIFDIALLVGVVVQRIVISIASGITLAVVNLIRYVLSHSGNHALSWIDWIRSGARVLINYVANASWVILRVFTQLWMFTAGVAKFFWSTLLDTVRVIACRLLDAISSMWSKVFDSVIHFCEMIVDAIIVVSLGSMHLIQSCVMDVCATVRRISDGYFAYQAPPAPPAVHSALDPVQIIAAHRNTRSGIRSPPPPPPPNSPCLREDLTMQHPKPNNLQQQSHPQHHVMKFSFSPSAIDNNTLTPASSTLKLATLIIPALNGAATNSVSMAYQQIADDKEQQMNASDCDLSDETDAASLKYYGHGSIQYDVLQMSAAEKHNHVSSEAADGGKGITRRISVSSIPDTDAVRYRNGERATSPSTGSIDSSPSLSTRAQSPSTESMLSYQGKKYLSNDKKVQSNGRRTPSHSNINDLSLRRRRSTGTMESMMLGITIGGGCASEYAGLSDVL